MSITLLTILALSPVQPAVAQRIFVNGRIWTGDNRLPEAQAIAVSDGRILKVGTDVEVKALAGTTTATVDLQGRRVVPGFYDSHLHLIGGGRSLSQVDLKDANDEAEFGRRLKEFDAKLPKNRWITGGNWDHDRAFNGSLPSAEAIDKYVRDRPVFINRYDGHMAIANSAAMKLAGITSDTKDIPGGVIFRDANNRPTGVLKDNAMGLVEKFIPGPDTAEVAEAFEAASKALAANGITSVQDMGGEGADTRLKYLELLHRLASEGKLTVRIGVHNPIDLNTNTVTASQWADFFSEVGVKGFMDGSLGSSTAKMAEPYASDPKTSGVFVTEPAVMRNLVRRADDAKRIVAVHAIGDQANSTLLDIYQAVAEANGPRDRRFRVEHAQHLKPGDFPRFKALGVVASMQPYHVIDDGRWAEGRIGAKRCESSYAYRALLDAGAPLAFGSDWPVAPLDVLAGIDAAVNRRTLDGKHPGGWFPNQRITVAEAVRAYTIGSAYAGFHEASRGRISEGFFADFVVLNRDIFDASEADNIAKTKVAKTIMNGKVVFETK